jgi:hypothetical protein
MDTSWGNIVFLLAMPVVIYIGAFVIGRRPESLARRKRILSRLGVKSESVLNRYDRPPTTSVGVARSQRTLAGSTRATREEIERSLTQIPGETLDRSETGPRPEGPARPRWTLHLRLVLPTGSSFSMAEGPVLAITVRDLGETREITILTDASTSRRETSRVDKALKNLGESLRHLDPDLVITEGAALIQRDVI